MYTELKAMYLLDFILPTQESSLWNLIKYKKQNVEAFGGKLTDRDKAMGRVAISSLFPVLFF